MAVLLAVSAGLVLGILVIVRARGYRLLRT
jgi:hypothetical protein